MASDDKVYERIRLNAAQFMETYPTAARLLEDGYERGYALGHGSGYAEEAP